MNIEIIGKFPDNTDRLMLTPSEPFPWIRMASEPIYSTVVYLGHGAEPSTWRDATQEEYEADNPEEGDEYGEK
jgi:hypothetical protein